MNATNPRFIASRPAAAHDQNGNAFIAGQATNFLAKVNYRHVEAGGPNHDRVKTDEEERPQSVIPALYSQGAVALGPKTALDESARGFVGNDDQYCRHLVSLRRGRAGAACGCRASPSRGVVVVRLLTPRLHSRAGARRRS